MNIVQIDMIYTPSENVVAREIEGEVIIVPLTAGVGDTEGELYSLNDIGKAVWERLDGKTSLKNLISSLAQEYEGGAGEIEADVLGFMGELVRRRIVCEVAAEV